jgi:hypothetical protein
MIQFLPEWMIYGNGRQTGGFLLDWEKKFFSAVFRTTQKIEL